ncbi:unnamed protein product [Rotaria socialis]
MRTNSGADAWHRPLSSIIQCQHPTLWIFINNIKIEEHFIHCQLNYNISSPEQLQLLENCEQLLLDGTFKVTPSIFYQLYAMHVVYRNAVLPVIFALLPNKTEQTYRRLIDKASELCPLWNPKYIMMDY